MTKTSRRRRWEAGETHNTFHGMKRRKASSENTVLLSLPKLSTPFYNAVEPQEHYLLCHEAVWSGVSIPMFRRQVLHPYSGRKGKPNMRQAELSTSCLLHVFLPYSSSLKVEAVRSAETPVRFHQTIRHHIHSHDSENLNPASLDQIDIFGHLSVLTQQTDMGRGDCAPARDTERNEPTVRACLKLHSSVQLSANGTTGFVR